MISGIHHVSLRCADDEAYARVREFYCVVLGLRVRREWEAGMMIETGAGCVEVFRSGGGERGVGSVRHFAFACDDPDAAAAVVRAAGYEVFVEPKDVVLPSEPPIRARVAFCRGPLGEEIECFHEKEE